MGKSYVLKEKNEKICGFVMQTGSNLSYRITHFEKKPLMLTAVYSEGESICAEVTDSDEHRQKAGSGELLCAYAVFDGELLMDTGEDARNAYCCRKSNLTRKAQSSSCDFENTDTEIDTRALAKDVRTDSIRREKRWPPPPCIPYARFLNGEWIDQSMGV